MLSNERANEGELSYKAGSDPFYENYPAYRAPRNLCNVIIGFKMSFSSFSLFKKVTCHNVQYLPITGSTLPYVELGFKIWPLNDTRYRSDNTTLCLRNEKDPLDAGVRPGPLTRSRIRSTLVFQSSLRNFCLPKHIAKTQ